CRSEFFDMVVLRAAGASAAVALADDLRQVLREFFAQLRVLETELDGRLQVTELRAAIVALALERIREDGLVGEQRRDAVRQLDLTAGAARRRLELVVDTRGQYV